ncbi:MAG: hypothetical protein NVSMB27_21660 [Ktedonobacteraceae bacterium]
MDGTTGKPDGAGSHIWLHYTTQFTVGGRTHTIEMDIPIPIGSSADMRERLLHEAEAAMHQLTSLVGAHSEASGARFNTLAPQGSGQPHNQPSQQRTTLTPKPSPSAPAASPVPAAMPANQGNKPAILPPAVPASAPDASPSLLGSGSASHGNSGASPSAASPSARDTIHQTAPPLEGKEVQVPPTRPNVGASMPSAPGMVGSISGNLTIPQFLQFLKENMGGMSARQAMDLLKVKSLNGLNLREALEQLQQIVGREAASATPTTVGVPLAGTLGSNPSTGVPLASIPTPPASPAPAPGNSSRPAPIPIRPPADQDVRNPAGIKEITNAVVRDVPPAYAFDEEIDLDLDEVEEEEEMEYMPELTDQERTIAELVINKLKEARGSSSASEARIRVVHNVVDSQIGEEQLQELIQGVWGATTLKKLENDQVEALISWAKEDDFVSELEMVLILLQEDQYARSDR